MDSPQSTVTSLEWAKKLQVAGFPQQTEFFIDTRNPDILVWDKMHAWDWNDCFAATPTAEEILRRLPPVIEEPPRWENGIGMQGKLTTQPNAKNEWVVSYDAGHGPRMVAHIKESLADAAAAMYVWLAEHKLLPTP